MNEKKIDILNGNCNTFSISQTIFETITDNKLAKLAVAKGNK